MFIDQAINPTIGAPAERDVADDESASSGYVSLLRSEKNLLGLAFYKHFVPTGRGAT